MPQGISTPAEGSRHFVTALRLAVGGLLGCVVLQLFLYLRPGAYGGPFLVEWQRYFWLALYYEMLGVWLLSLPFFAWWLANYRRRFRGRWAHGLHAVLLTLNLFLSQVDHEALRFLGIRLGFSFAATYVRTGTVTDSLFYDAFREDPGGPFLSLVLLIAVPALFAWWTRRQIVRQSSERGGLWLSVALILALVPLLAPANGWRMATSQFRLRKVEPVTIALAVDAVQGFEDLNEPADFKRLAADYQARWLSESADKAWRFPDPRRPYLREPTTLAPPPEGEPWNVILIQLETLRGLDVGLLNPARRPSPTPYLDSLARGGEAAVFTRTSSFAQPTINAMFAAHCSVTPHSRRYVTSFTQTAFDCLPETLRRRGYRAEMFNAGDTDWDGSTFWLTRWYDSLRRFPDARERDRPVFRAAAGRIRELGRSGRPFLASVVSVTNHTPFTLPERAFGSGEDTPQQRIVATTRYTDDVVREFIAALEAEPWFERTIVVVYGDHGFNLGEHGGTPGEINLYREGTWVPLIITGAHPRLPRGIHPEPASLLDIAPTLADLLGIREANSWQGHSLVAPSSGRSFLFVSHGLVLAEAGRVTVVTDPVSGLPKRFDRARDWRQRRPLVSASVKHAAAARSARDATRLNDYLLRGNRIWRPRDR